MHKIKSFFLLFLVFCLIVISSCREEIIHPDSPGNINEPLLTITNNSYTFVINAINMSNTVIDKTFLQAIKTSVYSIITDHASGYVEVKILTSNDNVIFNKIYSDDTGGTFDNIDGFQPDKINLKFNNFTGQLRLRLSKID